MTEWRTRIGYLPPGLADEAKRIVIDKVADESTQYELMRLVEQAFATGYEAGFIRSHTEESWRQFRAAEAAKKQTQEEQSS